MRARAPLTLLLMLPSTARAQDIATDRPGNGNAAVTVEPLRLQLETSVGYAYTEGADDLHQVFFPVGVRFGILQWLEARLLTGIVGIEHSAGTTNVRGTDTGVGAKASLLSNEGFVPDLAVMTDVFLPTGGGTFTSDVVVPEFRAAAAWSLPAGLGLFGNLGFEIPDDGQERFVRVIHLAQVYWGFDVGGDRVTLFVETFGRTPFDDRPEVFQIDAGILWLLGPDLQLDVFTQHRIAGATPDHQVALGFSYRI